MQYFCVLRSPLRKYNIKKIPNPTVDLEMVDLEMVDLEMVDLENKSK